jgi:hypothetical protein
MLHRVALVRTDDSEELGASIIRVTRIGELGTTLAVTATDARCDEIVLHMLRSSETSALTKATPRSIAEEGIHHGHRRENLKSYLLHAVRRPDFR